jgi:predicted ATPase
VLTEPSAAAGFVGRSRELAVLHGWMEEAAAGRGGLALLSGAPGIGKSRLAAELATTARERGHLVLNGRGWADAGTVAYWPWIQVLRGYLRSSEAVDVRRHLGLGALEVARVIPELAERAGIEVVETEIDPDVARFRLFDGVTALLRGAAERQPLLVVLDDLHAADTPSVELLRFLVSQLADAAILVIATYRDLDITPDHPSASVIDVLARDPNARPMSVAGLAADDAGRLIASMTDARPDASLVDALWRGTGGNPLFLAQAVQLLASEGRLSSRGPTPELAVAVPREIRDVIVRRAAHLGEDALRVLPHAAVLGPEWEVGLLRDLVDMDATRVDALARGAIGAGLLAETPGAPGQLRFTHDLIRESLLAELPRAEQVALHRRIVTTLESRYADRLDEQMAALAHHAVAAVRGQDRGPGLEEDPLGARAIEYAQRAGDQAARLTAFAEAARLYRTALVLDEDRRVDDDEKRLGLLLSLGDVEARANNLEASRAVFSEAIDQARRIGSPVALAQAVLGYGGRFVWARAGSDLRIVPLLREALVMLGGADEPLRARLLVRLACAIRSDPDFKTQGAALSQQAVEIARRMGDSATLTYVLGGRAWAIWWPDNVEERMAIAHELLSLAEEAADPERAVDAHTMLCLSYVDQGRLDRARAELEELARIARRIGQPAQLWLGAATRAMIELAVGNYPEAARLMASEMAEGRPTTPAHDDVSAATMHRYLLARERGTVADEEASVRASVAEFTWYPLHRGALANLLADLGRDEEAAAVLGALAADEFAVIHEDNEWLIGITLAAEAAARLGMRDAASVLYRKLLPRAGVHAVGHPEGSVGSASRYLGLLAGALGDGDAAIGHLDEAVRHNAQMGLRPWTAHAQADLADALARRGGPGDAERAEQLRREARVTAEALGMTALARRLASSGAVEPAANAGESSAVFRREGDYWTVRFGGTTSRVRDRRGMHHLARLLASPGREIHALDLAQPAGATPLAPGSIEPGEADPSSGTGPILDAAAKAAYRTRIAELEAEVAEAESWNDPERASRARVELQAVAEQLAGAVGLAGRDRTASSNAERARISVTRAIRAAVEHLTRQNTSLGAHLEATIHTGTFCEYRPDPRVATSWQF